MMKSILKHSVLFILSILLIGCDDDSEKALENGADFMCNYNFKTERIFKYDAGRYNLFKYRTESTGTYISSVDKKNTFINDVDSTDMPQIKFGEYDYVEIKFLENNKVDLIRKSYYADTDTTYNLVINWVSHCEIIKGSKSQYDRGGDIKLKSLNTDSYDANQSILEKVTFTKSRYYDPNNSKSVFKTSNMDITCNKQEIAWNSKSSWKGEFVYADEIKELLNKK